MAGRQRDGWARVQVRARVFPGMFRRRVAAEDLKGSDSVRHRRRARDRMKVALAGSHRQCPSIALRRLPGLLAKRRLAREKEGRAPMGNLAGRQGPARQREPSAARSQSAERKKQRKNRHRQGRSNSGVNTGSEAAFCSVRCPQRSRPLVVHLNPLRQRTLQELGNLHRIQGCAFEQLIA